MLPHGQRQAANVVEVTVRHQDEIEGLALEFGKVRSSATPGQLGVQSAIHEDPEIAQLKEQRVCADAAVAVQVDEIHLRTREGEAQPGAVQA